MSSDSDSNAFPSLSGGIPTRNPDLVASVIFCIAYAVPTIFVLAQAIAYALRALIANGNQSTNVYKVSEILLLAGFTLICEPIPALLTRILGKKGDGIMRVTHMPAQQKILGLLRIAVVVALILSIVGATSLSDHETPSQTASVQHYREAASALIIAAMLGSSLIAVSLMKSGLLSGRAALWMFFQTILIIISAVYKLVSTIHPGGNFSTPAKVVFYILNGAVSWLVGIGYFAVNLNDLFVEQATLDLEMQNPAQTGWTPNGQMFIPKANNYRQSRR